MAWCKGMGVGAEGKGILEVAKCYDLMATLLKC